MPSAAGKAILAAVRILGISNFFPPHGIGGYEILCRDTLFGLRQRGHEIRVVAGRGLTDCPPEVSSVLFPSIDEAPGLYTAGGKGLRCKLHLYHGANRAAVAREVESFDPHLVSAWNLALLSLAPLFALRGRHIVVHLADPWFLNHWVESKRKAWEASRRWRDRLEHALVSRAYRFLRGRLPPIARFVVPCAYLRDLHVRAGLAAERFAVIPHGIPVEAYPTERPRNGPGGSGPTRFLFAGSLWEGKGAHVALAGFAKLRRRRLGAGRGALLTIAGGGGDETYRERLRSFVRQEGLEDEVTFSGPLPREELPKLYGAHDVLIFPSTWQEPFALTLLEAMASGMPILASATGGTPEIVEPERNGLLFPSEDATALARQMERLVAEPRLARSLGAWGRTLALERFDLHTYLDRVHDLYTSIAV